MSEQTRLIVLTAFVSPRCNITLNFAAAWAENGRLKFVAPHG